MRRLRELEVWLCHEMCVGLRQLHECGVVHCDVKLDNFLVHITGAAAALSMEALLQQPLHILRQHVHVKIADLEHSYLVRGTCGITHKARLHTRTKHLAFITL